MLGDKHKPPGEEPMKLLEELELNHPEEVERTRIVDRFKLKAPCWVRPGNLSQRDQFAHAGNTREVSEGGLLAVLPRPVAVGDIFHVSFDRQVLDLPPLLAQCTKCRMEEDDAFEVSLVFFRDVEFPGRSGSG